MRDTRKIRDACLGQLPLCRQSTGFRFGLITFSPHPGFPFFRTNFRLHVKGTFDPSRPHLCYLTKYRQIFVWPFLACFASSSLSTATHVLAAMTKVLMGAPKVRSMCLRPGKRRKVQPIQQTDGVESHPPRSRQFDYWRLRHRRDSTLQT